MHTRPMRLSSLTVLLLAQGIASRAAADLQHPVVTLGNVTITQNGNFWLVQQGTMVAIVQYSQFNIGALETVQFLQPNDMARILNKVSGDFPTQISGTLLANGKVYIVNPAGVFI